jgi:acylphosphatase
MKRRTVAGLVLGAFLVPFAFAVHAAAAERKVEGIVCELTDTKLVVMTKGTKDVKVPAALTAETKYRKGQENISRADLEMNQKVVVKIGDKDGVAVALDVEVIVPQPPHRKQ